jgi:undecaprenyl-diphosphatase
VFWSAAAFAGLSLAGAARSLATEAFDYPVVGAANILAHRSRILDYAMQALAGFDLFQGIPLVALACGAAATVGGRERARLVIGLFAAGLASLLSRLIQGMLPSLSRPIVDPDLGFQHPFGGDPEQWVGWSSFPSDHATLLWGMAMATLLVNKPFGALAVAVAAVSSLARIYCGLHFPSDTIGGALLGTAVVCGAVAVSGRLEGNLVAFATQRPAVAATIVFLFIAQADNFFYDLRTISASTARHVMDAFPPNS